MCFEDYHAFFDLRSDSIDRFDGLAIYLNLDCA